MAVAAGTSDELAEEDVAEIIVAPAIGIPALHLGRLLPALSLHAVGEAPLVRILSASLLQVDLVLLACQLHDGG